MKSVCLWCFMTGSCAATGLTGNWLVAIPNGDGTMQRTYLNLKQQDGRITGTIRWTLHLFTIDRSSGGPDNFTISGVMMVLGTERRMTYKGNLVGDELHLVKVLPEGPGEAQVARRVP